MSFINGFVLPSFRIVLEKSKSAFFDQLLFHAAPCSLSRRRNRWSQKREPDGFQHVTIWVRRELVADGLLCGGISKGEVSSGLAHRRFNEYLDSVNNKPEDWMS
ncbi:MAG: hypothetical protein KAW46_02860 [candidate division Zixibacteria bacterium]|nr:hypothetical protein [candidate division Zixibacteria bacterium]